MSDSIPKSTIDEERWGAAATILSLDTVAPFFEHMGVPVKEPAALQRLLRECIVANRKDFESDPTRIPDLRKRWLAAIATRFGQRAADDLESWVTHDFMHTAADFRAFSLWYYVLALARVDHWNELHLPADLSKEALRRLNDVLDRNELHKLADAVEEKRLSDWDLEMYALHGFDEDENAPYNWVLETVKRRRFTSYMRWLGQALIDKDRAEFIRHANTVKNNIETTRGGGDLSDFNDYFRYDSAPV